MFEASTVFVLGAGASWHYGYPTGEQLVLDVVEMAKKVRTECWRRLKSPYPPDVPTYVEKVGGDGRAYWTDLQRQCADLIDRMETVRPLVIDYFLGWNPSLREIGKLLIAAVMLKCEATYFEKKANINRLPIAERSMENPTPEEVQRINISAFKDNWYRFITHKLASKCTTSKDLLKNRVHFVTFNYDYSLEEHLTKSLSAIDMFGGEDIREFVSPQRILHVYGSVRDTLPCDGELTEYKRIISSSKFVLAQISPAKYDAAWPKFLDACKIASEKIRTIDPGDKEHEPSLVSARQWIADAQTAYVLGYGFDEANSERIGLNKLARSNHGAMVFFTNFKNANSVNKKVGQLVGNYRLFLEQSIAIAVNGTTFEKSERDVYEALELDFGLI